MTTTNPLLKYPLDLQERVEELRVQKQNALIITKLIESEFSDSVKESGERLPTFTDINKYIKWAKVNRGVVLGKTNTFEDEELSSDTANIVQESPAFSVNISESDAALIEPIDLSNPKSTLEDVKKRLQLSINRLEKQRISFNGEYNDKLEATLKDYYKELARHTQTEVKMAEDLKDSDTISVGTIVFILNKLFQCVRQTIAEIAPDKAEFFFTSLLARLKATKVDELQKILQEHENGI